MIYAAMLFVFLVVVVWPPAVIIFAGLAMMVVHRALTDFPEQAKAILDAAAERIRTRDREPSTYERLYGTTADKLDRSTDDDL